MGENTKIEWAHHTFNPWWGCVRVSEECTRCYAETFAKRIGQRIWGPTAPRRFFGDAHWSEPLKWNRQAAELGERHGVFCASMADVFEDRDELASHRGRLWELIEATPNLHWRLLTKRPENAMGMTPASWQQRWPSNIAAGTTVGHPDSLHRIATLRQIPADLRFLSVEPLLAYLDLSSELNGIGWILVGGESGPGARRCDVAWIRSVIEQCRKAKVPVLVKQLGANVITRNDDGLSGADEWDWQLEDPDAQVEENLSGYRDGYQGAPVRVRLRDRKGGNWNEWPDDLRVREFPR